MKVLHNLSVMTMLLAVQGRLAQDINVLNAFFSQRVGQEKVSNYFAHNLVKM